MNQFLSFCVCVFSNMKIKLSSQISYEQAKNVFIDPNKNTNTNTNEISETFHYHYSNTKDYNENAIITYDTFIQKLRSPDSAEIVQSTKHFVHSITEKVFHFNFDLQHEPPPPPTKTTTENTTKNEKAKQVDTSNHALFQNMAESIHSYLDSKIEYMQSKPQTKKSTVTTDTHKSVLDKQDALKNIAKSIQIFLDNMVVTMKQNPSFWIKPQNEDNNNVTDKDDHGSQMTSNSTSEQWNQIKTAFETFLYSKCYDSIWKILLLTPDNAITAISQTSNQKLDEVMKILHFVNAEHLEIQCILRSDQYILKESNEPDDSIDKNNRYLRDIFAIPIAQLQSLHACYSPKDKLNCVYQTYKQIILSLSNVANQADSSSISHPTADDIIPSFIYTIIQAQPHEIVSNLLYVEYMVKEDELRGEKGYAFTCLNGAVQFLLDLNMDIDNENDDGKLPFAIDKKDWKDHLQEYQKQLQLSKKDFNQSCEIVEENNEQTMDDEEEGNNDEDEQDDVFPSVNQIRAARLRGENVDLNWVEQWKKTKHETQTEYFDVSMTGGETSSQNPNSSPSLSSHEYNKNNNHAGAHTLPVGFHRSYSFLGKNANDIRMGDIPQLLAEYHQLVNACESMLSDRVTMKKETRRIRKERVKLQNNVITTATESTHSTPS